MKTYTNKFHNKHTYLNIENSEISTINDFDHLLDEYKKPLQIGVDSNNYKLIDLLVKNDFILKRKCYEVEVTKADLKYPLEKADIFQCHYGSYEYKKCCQILYDYYALVHYDVSPLTASFAEFVNIIPKDSLYIKEDGIITTCAFVEENEIAYLATSKSDSKTMRVFLSALLTFLFDKYQYIFFESDDTDYFATELKDIFDINIKSSYDTYIKYYKKHETSKFS